MIPIQFLIENMGLMIKIDDFESHLVLRMRYTKKNKMSTININKKNLEMMRMQGYFDYNGQKIDVMSHYIANMIYEIEPGLKKFPIDFRGLENFLK